MRCTPPRSKCGEYRLNWRGELHHWRACLEQCRSRCEREPNVIGRKRPSWRGRSRAGTGHFPLCRPTTMGCQPTVTFIMKETTVFAVYSINSRAARLSSSAQPHKKLLQRSWRHSANVMRERSGLDTLCAHLLRNAAAVPPENVQKLDRFGGERIGRKVLSHFVETLVARRHQVPDSGSRSTRSNCSA